EDEIATEVFLPALPERHGASFKEVARRRGDYALCGVGAIVGVDDDGHITSARTGYVSVADVPIAVDLTEHFTDGQLSERNLADAGERALAHLDPVSDVHATARYRQHLVRVLTERALHAAHAAAITRSNDVKTKGA